MAQKTFPRVVPREMKKKCPKRCLAFNQCVKHNLVLRYRKRYWNKHNRASNTWRYILTLSLRHMARRTLRRFSMKCWVRQQQCGWYPPSRVLNARLKPHSSPVFSFFVFLRAQVAWCPWRQFCYNPSRHQHSQTPSVSDRCLKWATQIRDFRPRCDRYKWALLGVPNWLVRLPSHMTEWCQITTKTHHLSTFFGTAMDRKSAKLTP